MRDKEEVTRERLAMQRAESERIECFPRPVFLESQEKWSPKLEKQLGFFCVHTVLNVPTRMRKGQNGFPRTPAQIIN